MCRPKQRGGRARRQLREGKGAEATEGGGRLGSTQRAKERVTTAEGSETVDGGHTARCMIGRDLGTFSRDGKFLKSCSQGEHYYLIII